MSTTLHLRVVGSLHDDNSIVYVTMATMEAGNLYRGDSVKLSRGSHSRETIAIVLCEDAADSGLDDAILMNKCVRDNLGAAVGDTIELEVVNGMPYATSVHLLPLSSSLTGVTRNLILDFLRPYFTEQYRPVHRGDVYPVRSGLQTVLFKVVQVQPGDSGIVSPDTTINCDGEPLAA
eukprot:gnl/Spiro4/29831_TR14662_c0_g1_i1.p1 gnl/Spiro4/29831_TR14662_c0_g1~~gnl/Spiro4/29831_TR14662_c0_g1_i1.p1  ORF type:complete len:177 (+),score=26.73 gnl/Spiro4/29831_TR14662_c0_g1_i1:57-587(+)